MNEESNFAVWLTRIEGKMDLSNLRHDKTDARLDNHEQRLHRHANDISGLQARFSHSDGQRQGLAIAGKAVHWITGGGVVAIVAALLRHFGV